LFRLRQLGVFPVFHTLRQRGFLCKVPLDEEFLPNDPCDDDPWSCVHLSLQTIGLVTVCMPLGAALLTEPDMGFRPNPAYVCCGLPVDLISAPVLALVRLVSVIGGCYPPRVRTLVLHENVETEMTAPPLPEVIQRAVNDAA
jgi:hypothetical protein